MIVELLGAITFPGHPAEVPRARAWLRDLLKDHPPEIVGDVELCASETITNAVLHSDSRLPGGTVTLAVIRPPGRLRVEVIDNGSPANTPRVRAQTYTAHGHGLHLVQELSAGWGDFTDEAGRTVWFEVTLP